MFSCNLPPALFAEWHWQGSFTCYYSNAGVEQILSEITVLMESWPWRRKEKKLPRLEPTTFWSCVQHSNHWAIPASYDITFCVFFLSLSEGLYAESTCRMKHRIVICRWETLKIMAPDHMCVCVCVCVCFLDGEGSTFFSSRAQVVV